MTLSNLFAGDILSGLLTALCFAVLAVSRTLPATAEEQKVGVQIQKSTISRDDSTYECFPSLARLKSGRIVLVYRESDSHMAGKYCRLIVRTSDDNGETFSKRKVLVDEVRRNDVLQKWNCPKVKQLKDGRVLILCDKHAIPPGEEGIGDSRIVFFYSSDQLLEWSDPLPTTVPGIMPDEVVETDNGDWLLATQLKDTATGNLYQTVSRSRDGGKTWEAPVTVAKKPGYDFCEASILKMPSGELVCYMRENTGQGRPIYKSLSTDGGKAWNGPFETLMGCGHRPVAHLTHSGRVLVTFRHYPGAKVPWAKDTFAFIESVTSALEPSRAKQSGIVLPLDHDRSNRPDSGYTGWVEYAPQRFFAVNYICDDAPKAQIRGYRFSEEDF